MGGRPPSPEARGPASCRPAAPPPRRSRASPAASPCPQPGAARGAVARGGAARGRAEEHGEMLPGQRARKMAAPMELFCWSGGWGLPSVDLDSLAVLVRGDAGAFCCALVDWGGGLN